MSGPYDFDRVVDRHGTSSTKWDYSQRYTGHTELLPMWVADMDFLSPPEVVEALRRRAEHGIFGYTELPESCYQGLLAWLERRHRWQVRREWVVSAPGVMPSVNLALQAFTALGDGVVIQPPVYYPFRESILRNGRRVVENPLRLDGDRYTMDLEQLEAAVDARTKLLVLCSPHNPVGRVWSQEELAALADLCLRRNLLLISDEIHHDLVFPGRRHRPTASLGEAVAGRTVTCVSTTKTFNLAGVAGSFAIIPDRSLRKRYREAQRRVWSGLAPAFGAVAVEAAHRDGEPWLEALLAYLQENDRFLRRTLSAELPAVHALPLEGTYLPWLDLRALKVSDEELKRRLLEAGVWLDEGPMFGTGGAGFQRINIACPRATLSDGLARILRALRPPGGRLAKTPSSR